MNIHPNFVLHHLTIHFISKKPQQQIKIQTNNQTFNDPDSEQLAWRIIESYYKKSNLERTKFNENFKPHFQEKLDEYLTKDSSEKDFLYFSKKILEILKIEMAKKPAAVGGYFIVADITLKYRFICVAIINEKKEYQSNNLILTPVQVLDIDKLAVAAFINIDIYKGFLNKTNDLHYLSFVKGIRKIADYFFDFLGASNDKITIKKQTKELIRAIEDFVQKKLPKDIDPYQLKSKIHNELKELHKQKQTITIDFISSLIYPFQPNLFKEFVQHPQNHYDLDSEFDKLDIKILNKLTIFEFKKGDFSISFDKEQYQEKIKIEEDGVKIIDEDFKNSLIEEGLGFSDGKQR